MKFDKNFILFSPTLGAKLCNELFIESIGGRFLKPHLITLRFESYVGTRKALSSAGRAGYKRSLKIYHYIKKYR